MGYNMNSPKGSLSWFLGNYFGNNFAVLMKKAT